MSCRHLDPVGEPCVWVLGASGRSGRLIAARLLKASVAPALVGRSRGRLEEVSTSVGGGEAIVATDLDEIARMIGARRPSVVVNTIGPFLYTAGAVAAACMAAGSHYVDLANDVASVRLVLELNGRASTAGSCVVTGAGFGVTATESLVVKLCSGRPTPSEVRVDMVPSVEVEAGRVGEALAGTIVAGLPGVPGGGRFGGRRYLGGQLVADRIGAAPRLLHLPDGSEATVGSMPLGELVAAQRASGSPSVRSSSSEAPTSLVARALLPLAAPLLGFGPVRNIARRAIAGVKMRAAPRPRADSWGHAELRWADGTVVEGWLRVGEAMEFTASVCAEIAVRLHAGAGSPGAYTPAALFGPGLAEACGGSYVLPGNGPAGGDWSAGGAR